MEGVQGSVSFMMCPLGVLGALLSCSSVLYPLLHSFPVSPHHPPMVHLSFCFLTKCALGHLCFMQTAQHPKCASLHSLLLGSLSAVCTPTVWVLTDNSGVIHGHPVASSELSWPSCTDRAQTGGAWGVPRIRHPRLFSRLAREVYPS